MALSESGDARVVALVVPRTLVKAAKTAVSQAGWWGRGRITQLTGVDDDNDPPFLLPTTLPLSAAAADTDTADTAAVLRALGLAAHAGAIRVVPAAAADIAAGTRNSNPLSSAIAEFLHAHARTADTDTDVAALLASAPRRWSLYPPLALLPAGSFAAEPWPSFLSALSPTTTAHFYRALAHALSATHLALNAPILAASLLRLPHTTPLHGDLDGLWVTCIQNGIHQTWAPQHTMFSRGNLTEKTRVLGFPRVAAAQVADLYAGIGYFAFPYVAAGAARVWCWELSAWSCEALRRGAAMNGWGVVVVGAGAPVPELTADIRLVVFCEDNRMAGERLRAVGVRVRHVNLGLLPTSRGAWATALDVVDESGWVHVHENFAEGEQRERCAEVVDAFRRLEGERGREVVVVGGHVQRVKTFAPGVVHCVVDVRIGGEDV